MSFNRWAPLLIRNTLVFYEPRWSRWHIRGSPVNLAVNLLFSSMLILSRLIVKAHFAVFQLVSQISWKGVSRRGSGRRFQISFCCISHEPWWNYHFKVSCIGAWDLENITFIFASHKFHQLALWLQLIVILPLWQISGVSLISPGSLFFAIQRLYRSLYVYCGVAGIDFYSSLLFLLSGCSFSMTSITRCLTNSQFI